jgi:hypothetical protein
MECGTDTGICQSLYVSTGTGADFIQELNCTVTENGILLDL